MSVRGPGRGYRVFDRRGLLSLLYPLLVMVQSQGWILEIVTRPYLYLAAHSLVLTLPPL